MIDRIGKEYLTTNIEAGEYSYVQEASSKEKLEKAVGHAVKHFKLDIRFENNNVAVLIETKQSFTKADEKQLAEYVEEERALHKGIKIIAILANTNNDKIKVWRYSVDDSHLLKEETVLDTMEHYVKLFDTARQNDKERVMKNTYDLNELLHKKDIDEKLRSQFVGTTLLYIKDKAKTVSAKTGLRKIDDTFKEKIDELWSSLSADEIRDGIKSTLNSLLDNSENKTKKIELLQKNVLNDQKVKKLKIKDWIEILDTILMDIYRYIDADSSEGQDILNLFFIAFNKYTGKADKNQAFTPDHITEFMCRITDVDRTKVVLDGTCGSGSFLVQAMVKEIADCRRDKTEKEAEELIRQVKEKHIFGIEVEEKAYGLSTTNMLIHGDGNSNIKFGSIFDNKKFIMEADPDIILMNPPYNAKPIGIPSAYKSTWTAKAKDGKEDPTKGFVFVHFLSDVIKELNDLKEKAGKPTKQVKLAVLLPVASAIGTSDIIEKEKIAMLENNTLEAVFTLPNEIFYPGASACACCMLFTLGKPHSEEKETFFGYCKDDGFKKKKNLGRVEQFNADNESLWKEIEKEWIYLFRNHKAEPGKSATVVVSGESEWLCEAYMNTNFSLINADMFQQSINNYVAFLIKSGRFPILTIEKINQIKLDINQFKYFRLGRLIDEPYKAHAYTKDELEEINNKDLSKIRYITRTADNNGCELIVKNEALSYVEEGNAITIGDTTATCFYQEEKFVTGDHMIVVRANWLNTYTGLFIVTLLNNEQYRYSYGRAFLMDRVKETVLKLPICRNNDGLSIIDEAKRFSDEGFIPDWQFMEDYIKSLPYGDKI